MRLKSSFRLVLIAATYCAVTLLAFLAISGDSSLGAAWYKGNLHTHSSWSDGQQLPELVAYWYKSHGYDFLALTDHLLLQEGDSWRKVGSVLVPAKSITEARHQFGHAWPELRNTGGTTEVKLKTFDEINAKLGEAGKFLLILSTEDTNVAVSGRIITRFDTNIWNLSQLIGTARTTLVADAINQNVAEAVNQAAATGNTVLVQANHPNIKYAITPEELAKSNVQFIEAGNMGPFVNYYGDKSHPGVEKLWDIANTIRLGRMNRTPLYSTAADDAHHYAIFNSEHANPGRGWVMVRAETLSANVILDAMREGDFYSSTGVTLNEVSYDSNTKTLTVEVKAKSGATYRIDFVGTAKGVDPAKQPDGTYSPEIGKILKSTTGTSANYTLTGEELYVRAVITSDTAMPNPPYGGPTVEQAWTQPVGWVVPLSSRE